VTATKGKNFLIVAGLLGVAAAVIGYYGLTSMANQANAQQNANYRNVVVTVADLTYGVKLDKEMLRLVRYPKESVPEGAFASMDSVIGQTTKVFMSAREPVTEIKLSSRGGGLSMLVRPTMRAASLEVNNISGVSGFVLPGDRVDVLTTVDGRGVNEDAITRTVLQNVEVLAAGQKTEQKDNKPITVQSVTLLVDPEGAETLTLALHEGKIHLVLRNPDDQEVVRVASLSTHQMLDRQAVAVRAPGGPGGRRTRWLRPRWPSSATPHRRRFASSRDPHSARPRPSQTAPATDLIRRDGKIQDQEETMFSRKMMSAMRSSAGVIAALVLLTVAAQAQSREKIRIPVGRAEVVSSTDDVRTVAIAEPKIADAAVGSAKTVVVTAKSAGITTLVVYNEGARYKVYDVECFVPNNDKQVALHVRIAEVNNNASRDLGFDWAGQHTGAGGFYQGGLYTTKVSPPSFPLTIGPATDGFLHYEPQAGNWFLQTTWKALEESGDLRTLANSTLMAKSGEKATFLSGGEIAVPIASGATTTGGATAVTIEW
jgi:pilus assembly protein CpaB